MLKMSNVIWTIFLDNFGKTFSSFFLLDKINREEREREKEKISKQYDRVWQDTKCEIIHIAKNLIQIRIMLKNLYNKYTF
jgi:hypothetical protein